MIDPDKGIGHAAGKRKQQQGRSTRRLTKTHLRCCQEQSRGNEKGFAAPAVAQHADGQGQQPTGQRRHARHLADEILLITQAQQVEVVEQRKERHPGVD